MELNNQNIENLILKKGIKDDIARKYSVLIVEALTKVSPESLNHILGIDINDKTISIEFKIDEQGASDLASKDPIGPILLQKCHPRIDISIEK